MSHKNEEIKVKLPPKRVIILYIGTFLVFEAIFFLSFSLTNLVNGKGLGLPFFVYTPILIVMSVLLCFLSIKNTYYILNSQRVVHVRMGKETSYEWSHIIYIDEEWSEKHKNMNFFLESGKECFLSFDKEGLVYEYALQYARLISFEEFNARYGKYKL